MGAGERNGQKLRPGSAWPEKSKVRGEKNLKEILHDIVAAIIGEEAKIEINEKEKDGTIILELSVDKENMGKVIGRKGKIAKAIRVFVKACASESNKKVSVDIL